MTNGVTRGFLPLILLFLLSGTQAQADTITINFEGGPVGTPIDSYYAAQGITFSNAQFVNALPFSLPSLTGFGGIVGPGPANPIVIRFAAQQSLIRLTVADASGQGVLIRAYDAAGNSLGQAGHLSPAPLGTTITVTGANPSGPLISFIEIFQPLNTSGTPGGLALDNLVVSTDFTVAPPLPAPEPASVVLLGLGLSGAAAARARRRRKSSRSD